MSYATFVQPVFTSCHTFCRMSRPTFAQVSVICVLGFSSDLDNRPIQTLTNLQKETFMGVSYGDVRRHSIGPPRSNHWLRRSWCWYECTSLLVCNYVNLRGKSCLELLSELVGLNNPLAVETNNSATLTSGVLSSGTSGMVWWLKDAIRQSVVCWFNPSCCCVPAWPSFCCRC